MNKNIEVAKIVLEKSYKPLTINEIWDIAKNLGLTKSLNLNGKTPYASFGARIYTDIKHNYQNSIFEIVQHKPKISIKLKNQNFNKISKAVKYEILDDKKCEDKFCERDLHLLLAKFIYSNSNFDAFSKTIFHENSTKNKKGYDKWLYPDMIGVKFEKFGDEILEFISKFDKRRVKIYSFEIKKELNISNFRECYFQAVSNSSWANEGYLVALNINEENDELKDLINKTSLSFGIGVISLDSENLDQSKVLAAARFKESLDLNLMDELASKNKNFKDFMKTICDFDIKNSNRFEKEFDKILDDIAMEKFINDKGIK
ncbi:HrgA protein [Campylobacter sp. FMV-PI01]|uniref:HrgA protein n=1 Tax=Campylobacter portucalensis TaxID=2608384 RepID=A0A6L5WIX5_9BACT|nr:HTH domain-containing protein [Campylobacter portucalensis]MSN95773.1 HrgA protein [Campylobacter portucalensis]